MSIAPATIDYAAHPMTPSAFASCARDIIRPQQPRKRGWFSVLVLAVLLGLSVWMDTTIVNNHNLSILSTQAWFQQQIDDDVKGVIIPKNLVNASMQRCALWEDNQDQWWQDHPDYRVSHENDTHTCFEPIKNEARAAYYRAMHRKQFVDTKNCSNVFQKVLIGTGFGAAVGQLTGSFFYAFDKANRTFVRSKHRRQFRWLYNPPYNDALSRSEQPFGACVSQDIFCYYLPITNCDYDIETRNMDDRPARGFKKHFNPYFTKRDPIMAEKYRHHISYFTRLNQETRHRLYQLLERNAPSSRKPSQQMQQQQQEWGNCIAFHVRRTDATSERQPKRNFHPLRSYIQGANQILGKNLTQGDTIVLLTDDQSTIEEAHLFHPEYNWLYLNRTRYFGAQKRNKHFPSGDLSLEFLNIYADLYMARPCHTLIHGTSNMVTFIFHAMEQGMADYYEEFLGNPPANSGFPKLVKKFRIDADTTNVTYVQGAVFIKELRKQMEQASSNAH